MAPAKRFEFSQAFDTLTHRERLFLYLARSWARGRHCHSLHKIDAVSSSHRDALLDIFMCAFGQALPEPLQLKPQRCRCSIQFHEATLLAVFRSVSRGDAHALNQALADLMPVETIERLSHYMAPLVQEVDMALEAIVSVKSL